MGGRPGSFVSIPERGRRGEENQALRKKIADSAHLVNTHSMSRSLSRPTFQTVHSDEIDETVEGGWEEGRKGRSIFLCGCGKFFSAFLFTPFIIIHEYS